MYNVVCVGVWRVAERLENRAVASGESCVCVQVETVEGPNDVSIWRVRRAWRVNLQHCMGIKFTLLLHLTAHTLS